VPFLLVEFSRQSLGMGYLFLSLPLELFSGFVQ
jgi:hypothetical protein